VHCYAVARVFKIVSRALLGGYLLVQINRTHFKILWPFARMLLVLFFVHCYEVASALLGSYLLSHVLSGV